jgi:hypothetical protein
MDGGRPLGRSVDEPVTFVNTLLLMMSGFSASS